MTTNYTFKTHPKIVRPEQVPLPDSVYERLIAFWHKQPPVESQLGPIWKGIREIVEIVAIEKALRNQDVPALRKCLENLYRGNAVFGLDCPCVKDEDLQKYQQYWEDTALNVADALGAIPHFNERQPDPPREIEPEWLIEQMEKVLHVPIHWPGKVGGVFGAQIGERFVPAKLLRELVTATVVSRLRWTGSVLEIGGGLGFLAFLLAIHFGRVPYHITDLPVVAVLQAFCLTSTISSPHLLHLEGEETGMDWPLQIHGIKQMSGLVATAVNENSMPEMPLQVQTKYLQWLPTRLLQGSHFLSINQESSHAGQCSVHETMKGIAGMRLTSRTPSWYGSDYIQEIYQKV